MFINRFALTSFMTVAVLAGCGGSQPPIGAPGAMPQSAAIAGHTSRDGSWMLPEAKNHDLLYVSKLKKIIIYSYPSAKVVGNLTGFVDASGLCSDHRGDVWVTDYQRSEISEYTHAGTRPIAHLRDEYDPIGCAVDPVSGDLAVANYTDNFSVYPHGSGNPTVYTAPDFLFMQFCSYDGSRNLFVDGYRNHRGLALPGILELSYGSSQAHRFRLQARRRIGRRSAGGLQWDGKKLVVGSEGNYSQ